MERAIDIGFSIGCLFPAIINALDNRKTIIPLSAAFDAAFRFCWHRFLVVDQIETLAPRVSFNLVRRAGIKRLNPDYSVINKRFEERKNPSDGSAVLLSLRADTLTVVNRPVNRTRTMEEWCIGDPDTPLHKLGPVVRTRLNGVHK